MHTQCPQEKILVYQRVHTHCHPSLKHLPKNTMSKNNLRGIILGVRLIWGINSVTLHLLF